jgi:hypothetical protein
MAIVTNSAFENGIVAPSRSFLYGAIADSISFSSIVLFEAGAICVIVAGCVPRQKSS